MQSARQAPEGGGGARTCVAPDYDDVIIFESPIEYNMGPVGDDERGPARSKQVQYYKYI